MTTSILQWALVCAITRFANASASASAVIDASLSAWMIGGYYAICAVTGSSDHPKTGFWSVWPDDASKIIGACCLSWAA